MPSATVYQSLGHKKVGGDGDDGMSVSKTYEEKPMGLTLLNFGSAHSYSNSYQVLLHAVCAISSRSSTQLIRVNMRRRTWRKKL